MQRISRSGHSRIFYFFFKVLKEQNSCLNFFGRGDRVFRGDFVCLSCWPSRTTSRSCTGRFDLFKEDGYETLSANDVNEALALLRSDQKIDILFTDIQLGADSQGGLDVAQEAVRLRPKIPVVYSSGRDLTDGMQALFVEHSLYLHKPYDPAQLTDAVGALVNSFR